MTHVVRPSTASASLVNETGGDLGQVRDQLARCALNGPWPAVLAERLGRLHARHGFDLNALLACVDQTLTAAGRGPASPHVASAALSGWTEERARQGRGADDPLTGLPGADQLRRQLQSCSTPPLQRVLVAEVLLDETTQEARGPLRDLETELSLALVRAVLDDGVGSCAPWSRLGTHRLGAVVADGTVADLTGSVGRARRWLARWRDDVDVAAWLEPVPLDPGARGALVRDLAM